MSFLDWQALTDFAEKRISEFHAKRLRHMQKLELGKILKRKNPYLFRAKNALTAQELVVPLLEAHLSSQEETLFGDVLEQIAIFVSGQVEGGRKSTTKGIDLEFDREGIRYIVSIKSGPNWGNSSQIEKMRQNFVLAQRVLRTGNSRVNVRAVNGCCYGQDEQPDKGDYQKLCGQQFWEFLSGDEDLFIRLVEPIGHRAKEKNEEFQKEYARQVNLCVEAFLRDFCNQGRIDWEKLIRFNSGRNGEIR